jgi:hypothetical protein
VKEQRFAFPCPCPMAGRILLNPREMRKLEA